MLYSVIRQAIEVEIGFYGFPLDEEQLKMLRERYERSYELKAEIIGSEDFSKDDDSAINKLMLHQCSCDVCNDIFEEHNLHLGCIREKD